jgi:hypothetical protein
VVELTLSPDHGWLYQNYHTDSNWLGKYTFDAKYYVVLEHDMFFNPAATEASATLVRYWLIAYHDEWPATSIFIGEPQGKAKYQYFHNARQKVGDNRLDLAAPPADWSAASSKTCLKTSAGWCFGITRSRALECPGTPPPPGQNPSGKVSAEPKEPSSWQALQDRMKQSPQTPPPREDPLQPPPSTAGPGIEDPCEGLSDEECIDIIAPGLGGGGGGSSSGGSSSSSKEPDIKIPDPVDPNPPSTSEEPVDPPEEPGTALGS